MVYRTRANVYQAGCQSGRRQGRGQTRGHREFRRGATTGYKSRRRMEGRESYGSRQTHPQYPTSADSIQNGYNGYANGTRPRSPIKPRPYSQQVRKPMHCTENNADKPYQADESSPLDVLLNKSVENHDDHHGYGIQGLVKKFTQDHSRPSRQMLMLQQQIYQEEQPPLYDLDTHSTQFYSQFTKYTSYYGNGYPWQHHHQQEQNGYTDNGGYYTRYGEECLDHQGQYSTDHHDHQPVTGDGRCVRANHGSGGQLTWNENGGQHGRYMYGHSEGAYNHDRYVNNSTQKPPVAYHQGNNYNNHNGYQSNKVFYPIRPSSVSPTVYSTDGTPSTSPSLPDSESEELAGTVEIVVSNLDYNISPREWKNILISQMKDHIKIMWIDVFLQPDNTSLGFLKVKTIQEARHAIAMFHRKKLGYKRINLALRNEDAYRAETALRSETIALLSEAKGNMLPLFKFIELFNKKYRHPVSVAELYKMRDTIEIREQGGSGRMIHLIPSQRRVGLGIETVVSGHGEETGTGPRSRVAMGQGLESETGLEPTRVSPLQEDLEVQQIVDVTVCVIHCPPGSVSYLEAVNTNMLPNVKLQLKTFSAQVHSLLMIHDGNLPLLSFPVCYRSEVMPLPCVYEGGVPLEHLISCVPGVQIVLSNTGSKKVSWAENKVMTGPELIPRPSLSPTQNQQLIQLSRDLVDLLKSSPNCRLTFNRFFSAYFHHFGRQCRVTDYGYSRLLDLFESMPQVVQVLGTGEKRVLALTHKTQLRRFTSDLLRLLKTSPGKQLYQSTLREEFCKLFGDSWDIKEYGVCYIEDMLSEIPAGTIVMTGEGQDTAISVPRKDQTSEELEKTKQFCLEVVDLLKHNQQCRMMFNKFIPAYHHHFGRQCRVSDYGFTKLLDLFEAIPHVVEVEDNGDEKVIRLTEPELRKVVGEQIVSLLRQKKVQCYPLDKLAMSFSLHYGYSIPLHDFNVNTVEELMTKLKHALKVEVYDGYTYIVLADRSSTPPLARQVLQLLMDQSGGSLPLMELCSRYKTTFGIDPNIRKIKEELLDYVQISGDDESGVISLTPLQMLARDIRILLQAHGKVMLGQFEKLFLEKFGVEIKPALYGFPSIVALLMAIPHVVSNKGKGQRRLIHLSGDLQSSLPIIDETGGRHDSDPGEDDSLSALTDEESPKGSRKASPLRQLTSSSPVTRSPNLMLGLFSSYKDQAACNFTPDTDTDALLAINEEDRKNQKSPLCRTPTSQLLHHAAATLPCVHSNNSHVDNTHGNNVHGNKEDDNQSPDIIDHLLKYGWWRQSPESDHKKSPQDEMATGYQYSGASPSIFRLRSPQGHDDQNLSKHIPKYNGNDASLIDENEAATSIHAAKDGVYATVAYLREQEEQKANKSEHQETSAKTEIKDKSHEKKNEANGVNSEYKDQVALGSRPLQPGSYWFSKQFQSNNQQDELPNTSKQDVRNFLASLSGKQVKKPERLFCNEAESNIVENSRVSDVNVDTTGPFSTSTLPDTPAPADLDGDEHIEDIANKSDDEKPWLDHEDDDQCPSYESVFSPDHKLETSSVISDGSVNDDIGVGRSPTPRKQRLGSNSSFFSDESQSSVWSRGHRRCRIAAKFEQPLQ